MLKNSQTLGRSRTASMIFGVMSLGYEVRKRMRCRLGRSCSAVHEVAEVGALALEVVAVGLDGLAEERHFAHAAVHEVRDLLADLVDGPAGLAAAAVGDDAVGAELVAAVDDGT